MSVGAGSLKRTAKSVSTPKAETAQAVETVEVKKEEQPESTSGIKCELPVYLL